MTESEVDLRTYGLRRIYIFPQLFSHMDIELLGRNSADGTEVPKSVEITIDYQGGLDLKRVMLNLGQVLVMKIRKVLLLIQEKEDISGSTWQRTVLRRWRQEGK